MIKLDTDTHRISSGLYNNSVQDNPQKFYLLFQQDQFNENLKDPCVFDSWDQPDDASSLVADPFACQLWVLPNSLIVPVTNKSETEKSFLLNKIICWGPFGPDDVNCITHIEKYKAYHENLRDYQSVDRFLRRGKDMPDLLQWLLDYPKLVA